MLSAFRRIAAPRRVASRLNLEAMEDRCTPATFTVSNLNDAGAGSLRQAVLDANALAGADQIVFQTGVTGTITLATGQLQVTDAVSIAGPGAGVVTVSGNNASRVFYLTPTTVTAPISISGLTITKGTATIGGGVMATQGAVTLQNVVITGNASTGATVNDGGGGVATLANANLNLLNSTVSSNTAAIFGGGVLILGNFTINNSTISGNTAASSGGGVAVYSNVTGVTGEVTGSTVSGNTATGNGGGLYFNLNIATDKVTIQNSTVSGNSAQGANGGGGVFVNATNAGIAVSILNSTIALNQSATAATGGGLGLINIGSVNLANSIVAGNTANAVASDIVNTGGTLNARFSLIQTTPVAGTINGTNVSNITGVDPLLGPLADNGGPTLTHLPRAGSPAINAGDPAFTPPPNTDQRGFLRVIGGQLDIGAVEVGLTLPSLVSVGPGSGGGSTVIVTNPNGTQNTSFDAFPGFTGGVRVATADVNGDGILDYIVGAGPGGSPIVRVFNGNGLGQLLSFAAFEGSFTGGVYVAAGDINGDGFADIVVTPDQGGGPVVAVYDGFAASTGVESQITRFFGIQDSNFRGGARAAVGDVNGDGVPDIVVSAGFLGGPRITVWSGVAVLAGNTGANATPLANFFAFEDTLRNGAFVAVGDVTGDGVADMIFGGGPGGSPRVRIADSTQVLAAGNFVTLDNLLGSVVANFFSGPDTNRGGIRVSTADLDGDAFADLVTGAGDNNGTTVTAYAGSTITTASPPPTLFGFEAFPGFNNGVYVG